MLKTMLFSVAARSLRPLPTGSILVGLLVFFAAWCPAWRLQGAATTETTSALETDSAGWVDILPSADLKGWYRVAVPPTGKLGREMACGRRAEGAHL
jgi:hypothetical protein